MFFVFKLHCQFHEFGANFSTQSNQFKHTQLCTLGSKETAINYGYLMQSNYYCTTATI